MRWLFVLAGVTLLAGLVVWAGPENLAASLAQVDVAVFLLSPLLSLTILFVMTLRFRLVLASVAKGVPGLWSLFRIFCISNMFALVSPAKSGEFVKSYFLSKRGIDYGRGIIAVVLERVADFVCMGLLLIILAMITASSFMPEYVAYSALLLVLVFAGMVFFRSSLFMRLLKRVPILSKKLAGPEINAYSDVLRGGLSARAMAVPLVVTAAGMLMIAARMYVIFLSLGVRPDFLTVILLYLVVLVVGILSMIPGGLGSIEVAGVWLYSSTLGLSLPTVATALLLLRFSTFAVDVPAGIVCVHFHRDVGRAQRAGRPRSGGRS